MSGALSAMDARSLLFVPGDRLDLLAKVPRWRPDMVVVDLEDAVAPANKEEARGAVADADLTSASSPVLMRVNPSGSPWFDEDVAAVCGSAAAGAVLPKAECVDVVRQLRDRLRERSGVLLLGLESGVGVARAEELLATGASAAYFGAEDYIADLGGRRTPAGLEVLYARSKVALASRLTGVPVIDQAVAAIDDADAFTADAEQGRDLGYRGKICIHPRQVCLAHAVFTPTPAELATARRVLAAAEQGVGVVDGQMVDEAHVRAARRILTAGQAADAGDGAEEAR